jgi:thiamine-monophosphate kinase
MFPRDFPARCTNPHDSEARLRESHLLDHVARHRPHPAHVIVPSGDDLAAIAVPAGAVLLGVDQIVDGRHFDLARTPLSAVGWKAVARSVSDIAAMAGHPSAALAAVVLPADFSEARAKELFDAVRHAADTLEAPLVGGDIAVHAGGAGPLVLSVTILGTPGPAGLIRRTGAQPGDTICVTGRLGGSLEADGGGRHLSFEPRVAAGLELATVLGDRLHAMIDLSDGLGRDAGRVARASGVAMDIDAERLPRHEGVTWRGAVGDGEDYELCFAVAGPGPVPTRAAGVPVTEIGRVVAAADGRSIGSVQLHGTESAEPVEIADMGWDHAGHADTGDGGAA